MNEALCPVLSGPAPHQPFCGTIVPPSQTREYYLLLPLLGEGRKSLGSPSPPPLLCTLRARAAVALLRRKTLPSKRTTDAQNIKGGGGSVLEPQPAGPPYVHL